MDQTSVRSKLGKVDTGFVTDMRRKGAFRQETLPSEAR